MSNAEKIIRVILFIVGSVPCIGVIVLCGALMIMGIACGDILSTVILFCFAAMVCGCLRMSFDEMTEQGR